MITSIHISEGLRYFRKSIVRKLLGPKKYKGNANQICKSIIEDCWNGRYFTNSAGHFGEFWARDFGFTIDSLLKLGHRKRVLKTLEYALKIYEKNKGITTAINPKGIPFSFPNLYSPDSVAYFIRSLHVAKANGLIKKYKVFLNKEINKFYDIVIDKKTGLVKRKIHLSRMRDYHISDSSCYDNIMAAVLAESSRKIKILDNPFKKINFKKIIKNNFWTGSYFLDDLSGTKKITGDANIFPFWLNIFRSKQMLKSVIQSIESEGLDKPMPLKYASGKYKEKTIPIEFLVPNWENNAIWPHMGPLYIQLLRKVNKEKANKYLNKYTQLIEKYKTFYELYTPDLKPYKSLFYMADESVIWAINYLALKK